MAQLHVNSTGGTPTSPYDTWAKAAATIGAASLVAVAGDEVFVHPSHSETTAAGNVGWAGTTSNPVKVICGTPDTVSGITALQNTAIWGISSTGSAYGWSGSFYVHGISFRNSGSSGSATLTMSSSSAGISTFNDCKFYFSSTLGSFTIGTSVASATGIVMLNNCAFRFGGTGNLFRLVNRVVATNISVLAGSTTPTSMFIVGNATGDLSSIVRMDGFDFSVLANTVRLLIFHKNSFISIRNVKCPTGWAALGTTNPISSEALTGSEVEILNYGDGDTNHRYWIEDKQGRAIAEDTIKVTGVSASGNSTATYSKRLMSLTAVAYPNSVYRGPAITKYVDADGQYKGIIVNIVHDGATPFTNKDFWIEVSSRETTDSPLATIKTSCPSYLTSASALGVSVMTWTGFTNGVTTGPNGSSTWNNRYAYVGGVALRESGWITVTPCMSIPSKTLFMNDDFTVNDEGAIT